MVVFSGGYFDGVFAGLLGSVKGLVGPAGYLVRGVVRAILAQPDAYRDLTFWRVFSPAHLSSNVFIGDAGIKQGVAKIGCVVFR